MEGIAKACVALAALCLVLAVVASLTNGLYIGGQGYSRAANNLALLALCLFVGFKEGKTA